MKTTTSPAPTSTTPKPPKMTIVMVRIGTRPNAEPVAHAAIWINRGTDADVAKAESWAARENRHLEDARMRTGSPLAEVWRVRTYPVSEVDPLGRARADVLR